MQVGGTVQNYTTTRCNKLFPHSLKHKPGFSSYAMTGQFSKVDLFIQQQYDKSNDWLPLRIVLPHIIFTESNPHSLNFLTYFRFQISGSSPSSKLKAMHP